MRSLLSGRAASSAVPLAAAGVALGVGTAVPLASPLMVALVLGAIAANTLARHRRALQLQADVAKTFLRLGIVLLGLRLPLSDLVGIGLGGVMVVIGTVVVTYLATLAIGDALGVDRDLVTLIASGFAVCGAAAIAAVQDGIHASRRNVGLAIALVTVYGTAMVVLLPLTASTLGLSEDQTATWAGASIHEVAQVVAAASLVGGSAVLATATAVKLGRVLTLAVVYAAASRRARTDDETTPAGATGTRRSAPVVPWFVACFVAAVALRSTGVLPTASLNVFDVAATVLLGAGMYGLGLGLRLRDLWPVPIRVLALATASTVVAAGVSLGLVVALV